MPVSGVTTGQPITEAWGDSVAAAITALEAAVAGLTATSTPPFRGIAFPAVDVPNAGPNVLDDYEEGVFPPVLAYATPGTSTWAPTLQAGFYTKVGNRVLYHFIYSGVPTNGSAPVAAALQLSGLPYVATSQANTHGRAPVGISGYTKAGYTTILINIIPGGSVANFLAYGSGVAAGTIQVQDIPSLGTVLIAGSGSYIVSSPALAAKPGPK